MILSDGNRSGLSFSYTTGGGRAPKIHHTLERTEYLLPPGKRIKRVKIFYYKRIYGFEFEFSDSTKY